MEIPVVTEQGCHWQEVITDIIISKDNWNCHIYNVSQLSSYRACGGKCSNMPICEAVHNYNLLDTFNNGIVFIFFFYFILF